MGREQPNHKKKRFIAESIALSSQRLVILKSNEEFQHEYTPKKKQLCG